MSQVGPKEADIPSQTCLRSEDSQIDLRPWANDRDFKSGQYNRCVQTAVIQILLSWTVILGKPLLSALENKVENEVCHKFRK